MGDEEGASVEGEGVEEGGEAPAEEKRPSNAGSAARGSTSEGGGGGGGGGFNSVIRLEDVINIQIMTALIAGELLHFCWYSDFFPWGTWHTRSFTSAIAPDLAIAVLLGLITSAYVPVNDHLTASNLSLFLATLYMAMEGTHTVWYPRNLAVYALHGMHKFLLLFTMTTAMMYVRTIAEMSEFPDLFAGGGGSDGDATSAPEGGEAAEGEAAPEGGAEEGEGGEAPAEEEGEGGGEE